MSDKKYVLVSDVDGVLTDGGFYSTADGKFLKKFGADDWDAVKELSKYMQVHFITADKKGYGIVHKRIRYEMDFSLDLVGNKPQERWKWISEKYPEEEYNVIYVGDGLYDWYCLEKSHYGICPSDSLLHVKRKADHVTSRKGGSRFLADACLFVMIRFLNKEVWGIGYED
jgi:3-deoxy-D-manno-octulosonate 8-phosphate phosphatase (KDO 8-P phosphatase)